jgi:hypothetical protein
MNRTVLASALLLLLACGLAWSATADLKPLEGAQGAILMTKPTPTPTPPPPGPCTVSCWPDPYDPSAPPITCTSQTGNCAQGGKGTYFFIMCDGNTYVCPEF